MGDDINAIIRSGCFLKRAHSHWRRLASASIYENKESMSCIHVTACWDGLFLMCEVGTGYDLRWNRTVGMSSCHKPKEKPQHSWIVQHVLEGRCRSRRTSVVHVRLRKGAGEPACLPTCLCPMPAAPTLWCTTQTDEDLPGSSRWRVRAGLPGPSCTEFEGPARRSNSDDFKGCTHQNCFCMGRL